MLTQERANIISGILTADPDRAKSLLALDPNEALTQINALGNDFTVDEIIEFGKALKSSTQDGVLNQDALDNVAGGFAGMSYTSILVGGPIIVSVIDNYIRNNWF